MISSSLKSLFEYINKKNLKIIQEVMIKPFLDSGLNRFKHKISGISFSQEHAKLAII